MRRLHSLHKTNNSASGALPAIYGIDEADGGGYVIQGKLLQGDELAQLRDLGTDETAVWVDADVIDRMRR